MCILRQLFFDTLHSLFHPQKSIALLQQMKVS